MDCQKGNTEVAQGNQVANQVAKRAALQNSNLIVVATLVPQTNLPETPSYTESEAIKAKSEGFQEDHMGWFQKEGLFFLPGNLQCKLFNSLHHSFRGKGPPKITGKVLQRNRPPNDHRASGLLSHLPIKQPPRSSKAPAGSARQ